MQRNPAGILRWLFDPRFGPEGRLVPRWIFLRLLAAIYFSAFYALLFQIRGLIGPDGVSPAGRYLALVQRSFPTGRFWFAPTLLWLSSSNAMLMALCWIGLAASVVALFNLWPRLSFFLCFVCYLSFVAAASEFSGYQSDGMLLEAGFIALFFIPAGVLPGWGENPPSRASLFLLQWEWFRIYFESGMVKLLSGDPEWRHLTAMDEYYQNGPLPTWVGWYVEHLPHWFHVSTAAATLGMELGLVLLLFFGRRARLICFCIVTPWEIGVILTANYTFLNYLVLSLGFLLLDDRSLVRFVPARRRPRAAVETDVGEPEGAERPVSLFQPQETADEPPLEHRKPSHFAAMRLAVTAVMLTWVGYATLAELIRMPFSESVLPMAPVSMLEPFRIANQYGLFAVMTRGRYEIEFQGSADGANWIAYPFRNKPQALNQAPGIYAPYQPRFDWNLWFASLGGWRDNEMVPITEERLLVGDHDVLSLFRSDPFPRVPPRYVRAVLWQYWFTSMREKRRTGDWWRRETLGLYAPELTMTADGNFAVVEWPAELPPHD